MLNEDDPPADPVAQALSRDLARQLKTLAIGLGEVFAPRTAIYLDTCYWIHLRDARRGVGGLRIAELLGRLQGAVRSGHAFCPISESTVFELLKQSDPVSRAETARLMDELSLGVAILGGQARIGTELAHFIHGHAPAAYWRELHPLRHLVWTRGAAVMGIRTPSIPGLDLDSALSLQRKTVDRLWSHTSIAELTAEHAGWPEDDDDFVGLTNEMNRDVAEHQAELRSFQHACRIEAAGAADVCGDLVMEIVADLAAAHGEPVEAPGTDGWAEARNRWRGLLAEALRKGPSRHQLRSMHVAAALHAAFRWNAGQQFAPNDLYDFEHAGAALAHCQAFFTERPLWQTVTAGHVGLDRMFDCAVVWRVEDALAFAAGLPRGGAAE